MKSFRIVPSIENYSTVSEYLAVERFCEKDFVFMSKSIYEEYFVGKTGDAKVAFKGDFVKGEPTEAMMNKLIEVFSEREYDRIIAIGGGSVMDMAKILLVAKGRSVKEIMKEGVIGANDCTLVAVPATCGSGSEVSNISILGIEEMESKFGLVFEELFATRSVLIPQLLEGLPERFFVTSSIDGMIHGIESYLSEKTGPHSQLFSLGGVELYIRGLKRLAEEGIGIKAELFEDFSMASNYTGIAFSNTGTGAVHAISYPLSGKYHVTHGEANALFLVEVLRLYEAKSNGPKMAKLLGIIADCLGCKTDEAIDKLGQVLEACVELYPLSKYGMSEEEIVSFASSVVLNQQRLLSNSYVEVSQEDIEAIYKKLI